MAAHAHLKNEFTEDEKYHNLIGWLKWRLLWLFAVLTQHKDLSGTIVDTKLPVIFTDIMWLVGISVRPTGFVRDVGEVVLEMKCDISWTLYKCEPSIGVHGVDYVQIHITHLGFSAVTVIKIHSRIMNEKKIKRKLLETPHSLKSIWLFMSALCFVD